MIAATTANGGGEALELLMAQEFHLMLVDVMMPEMDGYSLIRVFKQASSRDIPSISMLSCLFFRFFKSCLTNANVFIL